MNPIFKHFFEPGSARLCGHRRKPSMLAQRDVGGKLSFGALAAKVSPFERFILGNECMQGAKRRLIEIEFSILHEC